MEQEQIKRATMEVLSLGFKDEKGNRIEMYDDMDCQQTLSDIIPYLTNKDFFTKETTAVLTDLGWDKDTPPPITKTDFSPMPVEELAKEVVIEDTLSQDIDNCEKLRDLKEIALSEPQFKKIRGRLSSYDLDSLKTEMLRILWEYEKPEELHNKLLNMPIQTSVENFEKEKLFIPIEETTPTKDLMNSLDKLDEVITKKKLKAKKVDVPELKKSTFPDDFIEPIDIPNEQILIGHGTMKVTDIITCHPFNDLFLIDQNILSSILVSMKDVGYDPAYPIILWKNTVIDGHTRLQAAIDAGIPEIPVLQKEFKDEHEALEYAMHNQRDRRNITEAELLKCISVIDTPMSKTDAGAKRGEKAIPSHKKTAKTLGVGESVVTDARTVLKDEKVTEEVKEGKKTLREGANEIRERKRKPKETISATLTRIGTIVQVLKDSSGKWVKLAYLIKECDNRYALSGGESNPVKNEEATSIVFEILLALDLIKITDDTMFIKKAVK